MKPLPEFTVVTARKVEPMGGGLLRIVFSVATGGAWVDRVALIIPGLAIPTAMGFVTQSAFEIERGDLALVDEESGEGAVH